MFHWFVLVATGGAVGSILRYTLSLVSLKIYPGQIFPWATLLANLIGCFLIGLLVGYLPKQISYQHEWKLLLITGFCGGLTTFSTFGLDGLILLQNHRYILWAIYFLLTNLFGTLLVAVGWWITK
ncbi:MAG: fluoride efflux transporter CrcB [Microscillaceae bacterium]|nr:fluoride efflux transporter CrcB [Microscillaceae bacterium]MDW8460030.1 fluoride efflux transporter CrcB [Cytophagales bacterium]